MSFTDLSLLKNYDTSKNDIIREFYLPVLKEAVLYKRAVNFFSSSALFDLSAGISGLVKNGGKIQLIVSPYLSKDDIEAISKGYDERKTIDNATYSEIDEPKDKNEEERYNWLTHLVASGVMEIKVALTSSSKDGMYHEKVGIFYDKCGNKVAFTGSMNETSDAFRNNYESIVVFDSSVQEDRQRADDIDDIFDSLWNGRENNTNILTFPEAARKKILSFKKDTVDYSLDETQFEK